jgi:phage terminase small subunit
MISKKAIEPKGKRLNLKQQAFVREYLVDFNAIQAALRSRYSKKG